MEIIKSALRQLRAHPTFSLVVILLLALGIGANTAIFTVVNAVLLRPLPFPEPGQLFMARKVAADSTVSIPGGGDQLPGNEFLAMIEGQPKQSRNLAAYRKETLTLQSRDGAAQVPTGAVTANFFALLGVSPWRGRYFTEADTRWEAPMTTVLSYGTWQARYGASEIILGKIVKIDDVPHTVIGIAPAGFEFTDPVQYWRALQLKPAGGGEMRLQIVRVFGRVASGASSESARAELQEFSQRYWTTTQQAMATQMAAFDMRPPAGQGGNVFSTASIQLMPLQEKLVSQSRATLWLLLAAVGLVLLIACVNIANLQLARAAGRRRDTAVRAALGASPRRLAVEFLMENLLLALGGGVCGIVLAWWGTAALQVWLADYLPRLNTIGVDLPVLGFALATTLMAGIGFGLAPAIQTLRVDLLGVLKDGGHQNSSASHRWLQILVAIEVALALVLAVNTGLLLKSIYKLYSTDLGYRTSDVMSVNVALPAARFRTPVDQRTFADRWLAALQTLPGVKSVALSDVPPLGTPPQMILGPQPGGAANNNASVNAGPRTQALMSITPGYFQTSGIALREGRFFSDQDGADKEAVAIVNESYVKSYFPDGVKLGSSTVTQPPPPPAPPGAAPRPPTMGNPTAMIVGVVADVRNGGFESETRPISYFPLAQQPRARLSAVIHFEGDRGLLTRAIGTAIQKLDPDLALDAPRTVEQLLSRQTAPRRITLMLTSAFAAVAVLLAAIGIFGVMSYTVTQRTHEIGVRMALGADSATILKWIMSYGSVAMAAGLIGGLTLTLASGRLLKVFLVGITSLDPWVIAAGFFGLALIGMLACLLPALRATRVNPVVALRNE